MHDGIMNWIMPKECSQLTPLTHFATLLILNSCPVVVLGGLNANWTLPTTDIKIYINYDSSNNVWENT